MKLNTLIEKYPDLSFCEEEIKESFRIMKKSIAAGGKLLFCGNGGSASDCEHIVGELMKGFTKKRPVPPDFADKLSMECGEYGEQLAAKLQEALPAISLVSHTSLITAIANDTSGDMIFAQQIYGLGRPEDVVVGLSTSGNSANIIYALHTAKTADMKTIGFTGEAGGRMKELCDVTIRVPWTDTLDVQERHLPIYHALCLQLEKEFFSV
ncbi:SIS domain-containing protein [Alteribacillus sp. HJP-4]|uniref:D-sedoheptulose-7-phosphate isomerase n=1 Tax=Alteribacillus sp. HJP-4 TaxID=2775394 RepID=UPI0035CD2984